MLGRTVAELEAGMSASEFAEWEALDSIQPILGPDRGDLRSGIVAAMIANVNRDPKSRPQPYSPVDFMPFIKSIDLPKEHPPEVQAAQAKLMAAVLAAGSVKQ